MERRSVDFRRQFFNRYTSQGCHISSGCGAGYFEARGLAMKNTMEYKGYTGSVEYSYEDGVFFGKAQFIRASISYEGCDAESV